MRVDLYRALGASIVAAIWASTPAALTAQVAATSVLRGEWLVERSPAEVFAAARDTMRAMGLRVQREDQPAGLLVTRQTPYGRDWPDAGTLDLTATQTPQGVALHVFVAPGFEPARLAVGAVLTTSTVFVPYRLELARGQSTIYGQAEFATSVAERIADWRATRQRHGRGSWTR